MNSSSNNYLSFNRTTNDRDGSRKENAGCMNHSISARRKTMLFNPQTASLPSISGRRQTMFIDTPNLPTKKSNKSISVNTSGNLKKTGPSLAKQKNVAVKTTGSRLPTPLLPVKTGAERSHKSNTTGKITRDSLALKFKDYLKHVPNRNDWQSSSNQSSLSHQERRSSLYGAVSPLQRSSPHRRDSSSDRRESSSHRRDSSSHRRDSSSHGLDSSSHRRDSSSHRRDSSSKRHSTSSESSTNRLVVGQTHKSPKKRSSKERNHPNFSEKKIRLTEIRSEKSVVKTGPGKSLKVDRKTTATLNNSSNLGENSDDYKIRKQSKSAITKETPADKCTGFIRPKDSKRIGSTTTTIRNQDPKQKDALWNPILALRRLNVDSLKKHGKSAREIIVSDDSYSVYIVDGKFKIKSKKNHRLHSEGESQQNWQPVGKADDEVFVTHKETRSISQQTEKRAFTRDVGVQKFDKDAEKKARQNRNSINLFTESVKEYETTVHEQQQSIDGLHQIVSERENTIAERERMIAERDLKIMEREQMIAERDLKIRDRDLKIKEYEEKVELQENNFHAMALQIDSLKQSKENLSKLFREQEAKLKDLTKDNVAPAVKTSRTTNAILPLRVRNIDEMMDVSVTSAPANSQHSHNLSLNAVNPTNTTRNSTSPAESFAGVPNSMGWNTNTTLHSPSQLSTQEPRPQPTEYLQMVIPSSSYMYMHSVQHTIQPTTLAGNSYDVQPTTSAVNTYDAQSITTPAANPYDTQPTMPKTSTAATPHQNLPKIVQRIVRPSNQVNSAAQNGSHDRVSVPRAVSQIRGRAKTVHYGSQALQQPFQTHQALLSQQVLQSHLTVQQAPSQSSNMYNCGR